jgi:glycosyltransferase involved in cell wall biosynthesis
VFNEEANLRPLFERLKAALEGLGLERWQVVLVDDGSRDGSAAVMKALAGEDPRLCCLHFTCNQGQTAALDAGIRHAELAFIATMDADLQNDPADLKNLLPLMGPGIGAVCGVRVKRQDSLVKLLSSRFANWVRNRLSQENITDTGCSLKLFRGEALQRVKLFEGMHRFLPTLVKMEGYQVVEVPVGHFPRVAGKSKYGIWNRAFRSFVDLLAVRWMKKRKLRYQLKDSERPMP